ncbi:hypothetical protein PVPAM_010013300 [Plasmodium vivax]|nr:hypothetical protein PVPAM_010013300 [Plasmodium vivax]
MLSIKIKLDVHMKLSTICP